MKLAVCIPTYDKMESMFVQSLMSAVSYFYETQLRDSETGETIPKQVETFVVSGVVHQARSRLVYEAQKWDADWILWCDCDHVFPVDAINRLLAHGKQFVGCNYPRRVISGPTSPTAAKLDRMTMPEGERLLYTTKEKAEAGLVEKCDHMGMGLVLMHGSVVAQIKEWADETGNDFMPLFHWEPVEEGNGHTIGEDAYFMHKCRQAGIDIWLDHGLSWEVGHIATHVLTHAHAERQRDRWQQENG